jgi:prephenate dehydrogenase
MSPEAHDGAFAAVSHLPHLIAFALMNAIITANHRARSSFPWPVPGFRDFTRIAASDPNDVARHPAWPTSEELIEQSKIFQRALYDIRADQAAGRQRPKSWKSHDQPCQQHPARTGASAPESRTM